VAVADAAAVTAGEAVPVTITVTAAVGVCAGVAGACVQPALNRRRTKRMPVMTSGRKFNIIWLLLMRMNDKSFRYRTGLDQIMRGCRGSKPSTS
jgi:hypothetical protein